MKDTFADNNLAENKVLILYILNNMNNSLTSDAIYTILSSATNLNYFDFQELMINLLNNNYISFTEKETKRIYQITEIGKETLNLTKDILPGIIKLKVDVHFKNNIETFKNEESIVAKYIPQNNDTYIVECKIVEENEIIFEIKLFAYSREQAQTIIQNWKQNAKILYPDFLNMLTKKNKE